MGRRGLVQLGQSHAGIDDGGAVDRVDDGRAAQATEREHDRLAAGRWRRGPDQSGVGTLGDQPNAVSACPVDDLADLVGVGGQDHPGGVTAHSTPRHDVGLDVGRVGADRVAAQRGGQLVECCTGPHRTIVAASFSTLRPVNDMATPRTDDPLAPYAGFGGEVGRVFATSEPWWPDPPRRRQGAPNVVVMMCDDLGFADLGCYGSEIPTPNIDRLAGDGLRYTDYHSTPMCSPTRAALLTGLEPHRAGIGHVAHSDPGFPGYAMELTPLAPTMAELLRDAGYQTLMVGKWHLTKDSAQNDAGDRSSWPCQRGFDRYYGFLDGFTNLHQPHRMISDNHAVDVDEYPEGYFLTDDLTDRAISMIRESKASDPDKPFLLYHAQGAVHAPLHAKAEDIARHDGRYDEGWDVVRERRHRRQLELGVIPPGTPLAPRNDEAGDDVPAWDELDPERQRLFSKYMSVYAAMVDNIDQNVGRLRAALEEMGEWDNTLFVFTSDNGGSREGERDGTSAYFRTLHFGRTGTEEPLEEDLARIDEMGGPTTMPHYPRGWAMVSNTPFRLYKINAHRGGHSVPFVVSWPDGSGARRRAAGPVRARHRPAPDGAGHHRCATARPSGAVRRCCHSPVRTSARPCTPARPPAAPAT